jgi:hypothetical protein
MHSPSENDQALQGFPVRHVADIPPKPTEAMWLIDQLWTASGVGIVFGPPKTLKTWLAAELALAVASGGHALGRFAAKLQGPVLFFAAEDSGPAMRDRFDSIATARGVSLPDVPVFLLDTAELRLDDPLELRRLRNTVAHVHARLLVLDPFVRCSTVDENSAQEVSTVLGSLRAIQRDFDIAVLVVHHVRKSPSAHLGQQLRGSGDFAAWYDCGLCLMRDHDDLTLRVEHRGAPAPEPLRLRLEQQDTPHLIVVADTPASPPPRSSSDPLEAAILARLQAIRQPQATIALRDTLKVRKSTLIDALDRLHSRGSIAREPAGGWTLRCTEPSGAPSAKR